MAAPKPPPGPPSSSTLKRSRSDLAPTPSSSKLPYAPRRRTPAGSVLVPLSPAEVARYRTFRGSPGTAILRKRKRDNEDRQGRRAKRRRTGDVGLVVEHYNTRPEVGVTQRQESPIIGLKSFNNWVKSVLISRFAGPVLAASPPDPNFRGGGGGGKGRVLDMGCGKGGDLTKWAKARIRELVGLDIAAVSIEQAQSRHATLRGTRFAAAFFPLDCYAHELTAVLPPALLTRPFDVVSLQFCMHYAFETEQKARTMLANVAHSLRRGGVFIGTIPNSAQLLDRLDSLPPNAEDLSWGNNVYTIRFEDRTQRPTFGHRYWFFLKDAVDDVPEYVVHWDNFVRMAAEYGLHPVYKKEFHEVFEEHHEHPEFGPLLVRMKVVDANEESQMDEDQWEAASESSISSLKWAIRSDDMPPQSDIYIAFAFEKR
ncbi:guanine-N(7)-methyltransferase [Amylocystis lapponica]|nr:guanine-N(7)-methyltransferase [Amylocystis lapponica]